MAIPEANTLLDQPLLVLTQTGVKLGFYLPEELTTGYLTKLKEVVVMHRTHPSSHLYSGGSVDDVELRLDLEAGVSYRIATAKDLVNVVEELYDMVLPMGDPNNGGNLYSNATTVAVVGKDGTPWFQATFFVAHVSATWSLPVDVPTGMYRRARVALKLVPTYAQVAGHKRGMMARDLPKHKWSFLQGKSRA